MKLFFLLPLVLLVGCAPLDNAFRKRVSAVNFTEQVNQAGDGDFSGSFGQSIVLREPSSK